jgi:hypothetical protein
MQRGQLAEAADAYGAGCHQGNTESCLREGRVRMQLGDLLGAQAPLEQAKQEHSEEAYSSLAELHTQLATPEDLAYAERLTAQGKAAVNSASEFDFLFRFGSGVGSVWGVRWGLQPMAFMDRRFNGGAEIFFNYQGLVTDLNARAAYQLFVTSSFVAYVEGQVGWGPTLAPGHGLNVGTEIGAKLGVPSVVNLNFAVGSSRTSPAHVTLGIGADWEVVLIGALYVLSAL